MDSVNQYNWRNILDCNHLCPSEETPLDPGKKPVISRAISEWVDVAQSNTAIILILLHTAAFQEESVYLIDDSPSGVRVCPF